MMEWISVEERLPEKRSPQNSENVLVCFTRSNKSAISIGVGHLTLHRCDHCNCAQRGEWVWSVHNDDYFQADYTVLHWMPLPSLPEKKGS